VGAGVCAGAGEGTSLLFCEGASQFHVLIAASRSWRNNDIRRGCEVVTVDQRSMTEVPCVRLASKSNAAHALTLRTVADLSSLLHATPPHHTFRHQRENTHKHTTVSRLCAHCRIAFRVSE
jgi:hypothetical protein